MAGEAATKATMVAMISAFSCLVSELSKKGLIDVHDVVQNIQATAGRHRELGNAPLANDMHDISEHLLKTVIDSPTAKDRP